MSSSSSNSKETPTGDHNQFRQVRLEKAAALREKGLNPYPYKFTPTHHAAELHTKYEHLKDGEETEDEVMIAGRIHAIRNSGMFIDLRDTSGKIQVFSHKSFLSEEMQELLKLLDIGDMIGVTGLMRRTPRGEITVNTIKIEVLAKALLPLPEKFHGLSDIETRYRQRYLDLITNEEARQTLRTRSRIIAEIRAFLMENGFLEVETPMLHTIPGGAIAKPFTTHHNALDIPLYLRIAPELFLKKLIVGGLSDKVFEINRCFRNEGISPRHNPEFTSVELYQAYADYHDMMDLGEAMILDVVQKIHGSTKVTFGEHEIDFKGPWPRVSMIDLVKEKTGLDFMAFETDEEAIEAARGLGLDIPKGLNWGKTLEAVFGEKVEPTLIQPIHVTDHPVEISPLAKVHRDNPRLTERFETFVNGWELANAFSELSDPIDQKKRFEMQGAEKDSGDEEAHHMDEDYLTALEHGMPPTGGYGMGIDRLSMLLTNSHSIRDVIAFPTMKPRH